jgi:hypothetical protein
LVAKDYQQLVQGGLTRILLSAKPERAAYAGIDFNFLLLVG